LVGNPFGNVHLEDRERDEDGMNMDLGERDREEGI
jgi:hypothetical protein